MRTEYKLIWAALSTAFIASLCCITPILALISGTSAFSSTVSWVEPTRPYLIVLTAMILSYAWYRRIWPKRKIRVRSAKRTKFVHSEYFLAIVSVFVILMLAFPLYSSIFYPKTEKPLVVEQSNIQKVEFEIDGMTCTACEEHIDYKANTLFGVISSISSYENGNTIIVFDKSKSNIDEIERNINATGYNVIRKTVDSSEVTDKLVF